MKFIIMHGIKQKNVACKPTAAANNATNNGPKIIIFNTIKTANIKNYEPYVSFYNISSPPPFTHLTISKPSIFVLYSSFSMQLPNQDFRGDSNSNLISPLN